MLKNSQVLFRLKNKCRIALVKESHLVSEAFLSIHVVDVQLRPDTHQNDVDG